MTMNDGMALAADLDRLSADAARLAERVRREAMNSSREPYQLTVQQATEICSVTNQAIYNWIEHAERNNRPVASKRAGVWIIETSALLAYVAKYRGGIAARAAAEARLRERVPLWSSRGND